MPRVLTLLQLGWNGEDVVHLQDRVWNTLAQDPLFRQPFSELELSREDMRALTFRQMKRLIEYDFLPDNEMIRNPSLMLEYNNILGAYDWSLAAKYGLHMFSTRVDLSRSPIHVLQCLRARSSRLAPIATRILLSSARTLRLSAASASLS